MTPQVSTESVHTAASSLSQSLRAARRRLDLTSYNSFQSVWESLQTATTRVTSANCRASSGERPL